MVTNNDADPDVVPVKSASQEAPVEMANETDDFGLPIKRFQMPAKVAPDDASGAPEADEMKPPARSPVLLEEDDHSNNDEGNDSDGDSDSDGAAFVDAKVAITPCKAADLTPRMQTPIKSTGPGLPNGHSSSEHPTKQDDPLTTITEKGTGEKVKHLADGSGDATVPSEIEETAKTPTTSTTAHDTETRAQAAHSLDQSTLSAKTDEEHGEAVKTPTAPTAPETKSPVKVAHSREVSVVSAASSGHPGMSEFSHQQLSTQQEDEKEQDDGGWQTMPAFAPYDMYDDDNRLIAREHDEQEDEKYGYAGLGGAGKGYTRVIMDDDARSATSMDENTQYLFRDANATDLVDDEGRDALSQMQATKDLLTEGQRIAYVGVVRLEVANLVKEADGLEHSRKTKKEVNISAESVKMWGQKMMIRLYSHMDISVQEQLMIEQLAEHGVVPKDLTPALHANSRVHNPMAEEGNTADDTSQSNPTSPSPSNGFDERPAEIPPPYEDVDQTDAPEVQTPSQLPATEKIDIDLRWTVLCDLFLILIADSIYDARSRCLLERVAQSLEISWVDICRFEKRVTDALEMQQAAEKENWNEDEHMENRRVLAKKRRYMMMGLATVGGGLVIGLSAGLLAPVIGAGLAAGFTTLGVTGTSSFLAGAGGAAIITSSAAASGSIIGGRAANRRMGSVRTFEYRPLHNNKRVNLIVTVSGWLTGKVDDVRLPFSTVDPVMGDIYSVLFEPEMLRSMGDTINILATEALTQGLQQILGSTILVSLMAALQLPVVLTKLSYLIDNPWAVSLDRATAAGLILADSLMDRSLGTRPITLVGYSIGARVVYSCLQELAKRGAHGLVQNVYLFGAPVVVKVDEFVRARTVVCGRFVNAYNRNDWILGYLFRLTNGGIRRVAGLAPVEVDWLENMDVTDEVPGHMQYRTAMPVLLRKCGWIVESEVFTEIEDPDPENHDERQRELINEIEEARKELEREGKKKSGGGGGFSLFGRRKKAERQEWEVYEDSAAKDAKGGSGKPDHHKTGGSNHGVLFDVDAIRAELAKESYGAPDADLGLQVKEIKSTLPPMRLDISSPGASTSLAVADGRGPIRETRSAEALPMTGAGGGGGGGIMGSRSVNGSRELTSSPQAGAKEEAAAGEEGGEMRMTFDTSFDEPARGALGTTASSASRNAISGRPEMRTAHTLPSIPLSDPWGDPDDEDFGKEKEISMTFA